MDSRNALEEGPYSKTNETELKSRKSENQMKMDDFFGFSQSKNPNAGLGNKGRVGKQLSLAPKIV